MNVFNSRGLVLVAALYFGANVSAQKRQDSAAKEKKIDEVVLIGYGAQKKSNVTGAISSISTKQIEATPNNGKVEDVLQGKAAGVTVTSNDGQPGSASKVRIRGIGTFYGNDQPLYIVDGTMVNYTDVNILNQSDIESIQVLKDAASTAIYGVQSGNGVILITTKKGKSGKVSLSYNGLYGISSVARKLPMLNASQYAAIMNEKSVNAGNGLVFADPNSYGTGTNWQDQIFNTAAKTNHEFSLSGGTDKAKFYSSFGYLEQEGIVLKQISKYTRMSARVNSTYKIGDFITVGENLTYSHSKKLGIGNTNSEFGGPISSALNLDPITPVTVDPSMIGSGYYAPDNKFFVDANGRPYGISPYVGVEMTNPLAYAMTRLGNYNYSDDFIGNAFLEAKFTKDLTFRSVIGGVLSYSGWEGFTPHFYLSSTVNNIQNTLGRTTAKWFKWSFENFVTYDKTLGQHHFTLMGGIGYYKNDIGSGTSVYYHNLPVDNYRDASFNFEIPQKSREAGAWDNGTQYTNASLFGRLIYDYAGKYLFTGIIRRDGSSKFGPNMRYGTFPSLSAGWVVSKEGFWPENKTVNLLKFKGGWGKNGNDRNLQPDYWKATITGGNNYTIGGNVVPGYSPTTLENATLSWEESTMTNLGMETRWFNDFTFNVDFYRKDINKILGQLDIPGYVGVNINPYANVYGMRSQGIDLELGYNKRFNDNFSLSLSANGGYTTSKVTSTGLLEGIYGDGWQSMGSIVKTAVGQPYASYYGFQTAGIFQNQSQIDAYKNVNGGLIQPGAKPGDFKWVDNNGDGKIDDKDRTFLGSWMPKYTFGFTATATYKNFDFMVFLQGAADYKIFQGYHRLDILAANYTTEILGRWTGEGTSNSIPRLTNDDTNHNYTWMSNYYLKDGSFLRIKTVQIGYSLPQDAIKSIGANKVRLYLTGENLHTFTKYNGFDPEIGGGDVNGVDRGIYPLARTFSFGANIQF